ncbi:asparagine synthase (glutamine-hydrolyzing) [Limnobacter sp. P1]|uniref:asparagine synthase (glutamine-hydrolyzing) n=1 Tax=Limnobacter olei TaxID=3031298 RepID=UPI0023AEDC85|nr:asparagine synthase (glutamine-hydrolyzing) [Limnobacter sp. P1]
MCGLAGAWDVQSNFGLGAHVTEMANAITHRGPDDSGVYEDFANGFAMAHRRLSIIELSAAGHQPMVSNSGNLVIVFNGEIYNHLDIRGELNAAGAAPIWRGHSDTETLLAAFEFWGIEPSLQRCVGMFAIAIWDKSKHELTIARDRFGEKPLYYGWVNSGNQKTFVFGSELKAIRAFPGFAGKVCREALNAYLRFMYVPAPRSIYQGIYKLEAGCLLTIKNDPPSSPPSALMQPGESHGSLHLRRWWSLAETVERASKNPITNEEEALTQLRSSLSESVRIQSLADVPLGAFLSGGIDSSTIVALMQSQASRAVKTFTIGFDEANFDESPHALAVAKHLGTEHHEMRVSAKMVQDVIPMIPWMYDEPFADSSQVPTHLVCKAAKQHVTVALSGDAGDELFGGYNRYFWGPKIWNRLSWLPMPIRQSLGKILQSIPVSTWDRITAPLARSTTGVNRLGDKFHKLGRRLQNVRNMDDLYLSLVTEWQNADSLVLGLEKNSPFLPTNLQQHNLPSSGASADQLRMMYRDSMTYLTDDILCKVDRAAMATSLETRVPFLDHRVVELAWQLPLNMKIRGTEGKWALRQILYQHVPRELIERPKAGFAIPIGQWLRGPLRAWAENLLNPQKMKDQGFLNAEPITIAWREHQAGYDRTPQLWAILMWQAWLEANPC